ncbi:MAG: sigma 54-interacting transcriptional regulator [Clostridia bacterium]|nr:sigma 54-interacting transcriptional regulator [Clostridia bacterium]
MKAAKTSSNVLIQGESGTGKELFAHSIHNHSSRKDKPFVAINCAAIPKELIESELFGYAKGSFTGGVKGGRPGKFELANGGTIFLDEIGEMPIEIQAKLLRVLQDKKVVRVGGESVFDVDVRIIAATNKNLYEESKKGNFRWDIYYRLNVLSITIPPLRERIEDVPLIVDSLIKRINKRLGTYVMEIDGKVVSELMKNNWKGNVRELENVLERMINMCGKTKITLEQLPSEYKGLRKNNLATKDYDHKSYEEHERELLITALSYFEGNVSQAARSLKISRNTLYNKMDKFGLNA